MPSTRTDSSRPTSPGVARAPARSGAECVRPRFVDDRDDHARRGHRTDREDRAPHDDAVLAPGLLPGLGREVRLGHVVAGQLEEVAQVCRHHGPPTRRSTFGIASRRAARASCASLRTVATEHPRMSAVSRSPRSSK